MKSHSAVVTGAARGIGRQVARELTEDGYRVVLVDLNPRVEVVAQEIGGMSVVADVTDPDGRRRVAATVQALGEPMSLIVNNAGITRDALVTNMTPEDFRSVVRVNLGGAFALATQLSEFVVDGGSIINLSSRAQLGNIGQFNYAVAKGGVIGLTRALSLQLAPRVRVNAVAPGFVESEMTAAIPDHVRERVVASVPGGRAGQPADIAQAVRWLGSSVAEYVNGQVLYVCGGRSIGQRSGDSTVDGASSKRESKESLHG